MNETLIDVVRVFNAIMASIVFGALIYKGRRYWDRYNKHERLLHASFTLYVFSVTYASVEAYAAHHPPATRVFVWLVANIIALYAFIRYRHDMTRDAAVAQSVRARP